MTTLPFVGREAELVELAEVWSRVASDKKPEAHVVLLKAERGIGKTRLALEFYRWLSLHHDLQEPGGYWPDATEAVASNLEVNPNPRNCGLSTAIPFLWWGVRCNDPGLENATTGDAIAAHDRYLVPHLVALTIRHEARSKAVSIAKAWGNVGVDITANLLQIDTILSLAKGVFATARVLRGEGEGPKTDSSLSRADAILADLRKVLNPASAQFAETPAVLLLDDAQFAHHDAALPAFVEKLLYYAITENWPVLFLVTHWRAESFEELNQSPQSYSEIVRHAKLGTSRQTGPAAGLPGGYLPESRYREIDLPPLADLSEPLRSALPGLTPTQAARLLQGIGGNPRLLEQIALYLQESEHLFVNFDSSSSLTEEGLDDALNSIETQDIFKVVLKRLRKTPLEVQEALGLASLQGITYSKLLLDQLAKSHLSKSLMEPLRLASKPYSMTSEGRLASPEEDTGWFIDRLFHQVAAHRRQSLSSLGGERTLQNALRTALLEWVRDATFLSTANRATKLIVHSLVTDNFLSSTVESEREVALHSAIELAALHISDGSIESALLAYARWLEHRPASRDAQEHINLLRVLLVVGQLNLSINRPSAAARSFREAFREAQQIAPGLFTLFIHAGDLESLKGKVQEWNNENKELSPELLEFGLNQIVRPMFWLSEIADANPHLVQQDEDKPWEEAPFVIFALESGQTSKDDRIQTGEVIASVLRERAYNLALATNSERPHLAHLTVLEWFARVASERGHLEQSVTHLKSALQACERFGDEIGQITTLNNLAASYGAAGATAEARNSLNQAKALVQSILDEPSFKVELRRDNDDETARDAEENVAPEVLDIPNRYSDQFDTNPEAVMFRTLNLHRFLGDILGNIGTAELVEGNPGHAEDWFSGALRAHTVAHAWDQAFWDLVNLARVASRLSKRAEAMRYADRAIELAEDQKSRSLGTFAELTWSDRKEGLLAALRDLKAESSAN
jgi:tetratricopeptide (TPR) repeat protein